MKGFKARVPGTCVIEVLRILVQYSLSTITCFRSQNMFVVQRKSRGKIKNDLDI